MNKKAFTLIELTVVAVIVGMLALVAIPSMIKGVNRGYSRDAWNNLKAIYAAQQNYSQDHNGSYLNCGNTACINSGLGLNIISNNAIDYTCTAAPLANYCEAIKASSFTMRVYLESQLKSQNNVPNWCDPSGSDNPCCQNDFWAHPIGAPCP